MEVSPFWWPNATCQILVLGCQTPRKFLQKSRIIFFFYIHTYIYLRLCESHISCTSAGTIFSIICYCLIVISQISITLIGLFSSANFPSNNPHYSHALYSITAASVSPACFRKNILLKRRTKILLCEV